ncbi:PucR family transcriptional regulator [Mycobacterium hackensackense]|uniref:PucR family transcriptional regulator n=1 Tax=Mycobacterium hackensackense TaxID=228909 RepID=UPI002265C14D|nr:PucR family transcriptional regulator [Mycobacterium hackensackense]MCV7250952.1 PucR family transcriptional regulator [Mycobacterium hackensackense]
MAWVLTQTGLALRLRGGATGVGRPIDVVLTTELADPSRWLSGNELVLTTGIRLPDTAPQRAAYLRELDDRGVAGLGFATGLTHPAVPEDLIAVADEIGLPLIEVPLETPFAAIVKAVTARIAELQYDDVVRVSRAQPHLTRAVITGGAHAVARELGRALAATVVIVDTVGDVVACHPAPADVTVLDEIRRAVLPGADAGATTVVLNGAPTTVAHQRIRVGSRSYGELVVIGAQPLSHIDQVLLGHANALLALDFDKPARLADAQRRLNSSALGLVLTATADVQPAWTLLAPVADSHRRIRALSIDSDSREVLPAVGAACADLLEREGYQCFVHAGEVEVVVIVPGGVGIDFAGRLIDGLDAPTRRAVRVGMSGTHVLDDLPTAVQHSARAAAMATRGGAPVEFGAVAGQILLSDNASRKVLATVAEAVLAPLVEYDREQRGGLIEALHAFLEANGQWETAAAELGIHRHTLRNRIRTAERLLDCDLGVARVRAELLLSLLAGGEGRAPVPN